jgi:4-diphosphocytidyl-2-C-methyl-D-erythritol kinase
MVCVKVAAPCKINLHLSVGERRSDGCHNLESIFQTLNFGDSLRFEVLEEKGRCDMAVHSAPGAGLRLPPEENIVAEAVSVFRRRTGFDRGLRVSLEKRVPVGGGLGGGSSDAASTLAALDVLAGTGLSLAELRDMALSLGSDVPFFLADPPEGGGGGISQAGCGGAAWVTGRGERILPLKTPYPRPVVLVNPGFPSPTGEAFRRLDLWREERGKAGPLTAARSADPKELIGALGADPASWPYWNDFLPVLSGGDGKSSVYRRILSVLRQGGAGFAGLSGAGSTCFGVFLDEGGAERAAKLLMNGGFLVYVTFFLASSPFGVLK